MTACYSPDIIAHNLPTVGVIKACFSLFTIACCWVVGSRVQSLILFGSIGFR
jgi:hypothetical protein